ncbi:hypothetical protein F511_29004 [Dorcoceras hygrometricum]|uniref:Uncharacterized protein n=1 Tax=Dorcoceras hygrometricum TaxID=472368 RepID=A0A2Z7DEN1_9LAMI|nr:hypothetical protein F511_29004 [Dorcoceras hygrometricum]
MHLRSVRKLLSRNPLQSYAKPKSPLPPIPLTTLPNQCSIFDEPNQRTSMISRTHIKYVKQYSADAVDDIKKSPDFSKMESKETVYFNEEAECARRAVGMMKFILLTSEIPYGFCDNANMLHSITPNLSHNNRLQNPWSSNTDLLRGDNSVPLNNILHQYQNGLLPPLIPSQQQRLHLSYHSALANFSASQPHTYNSFPSPSYFGKYGYTDRRESKSKSARRDRHSARHSHQGPDSG